MVVLRQGFRHTESSISLTDVRIRCNELPRDCNLMRDSSPQFVEDLVWRITLARMPPVNGGTSCSVLVVKYARFAKVEILLQDSMENLLPKSRLLFSSSVTKSC